MCLSGKEEVVKRKSKKRRERETEREEWKKEGKKASKQCTSLSLSISMNAVSSHSTAGFESLDGGRWALYRSDEMAASP